jgi:hypothetical protein
VPLGERSPQPAVTGTVTGKAYFAVGVLLLAAFAMLELAHWRWPWLTRLQTDDVYKQVSGFALLALVADQWRFSALRAQGKLSQAAALIRRHKWQGALAPVFFYFHSQGMGYAYTLALSVTFFAVFLTGLCNAEITRIRKSWFHPVWVTAHVGLSSALLLLIAYHVYIGYVFE